jgi:hypothetical protein
MDREDIPNDNVPEASLDNDSLQSESLTIDALLDAYNQVMEDSNSSSTSIGGSFDIPTSTVNITTSTVPAPNWSLSSWSGDLTVSTKQNLSIRENGDIIMNNDGNERTLNVFDLLDRINSLEETIEAHKEMFEALLDKGNLNRKLRKLR